MITRIRIQNYRSLIDVDVQLEPLTVLIGRSGTGKSNFVGAIRALRDLLNSGDTGELPTFRPLKSPNATLGYHINLQIPQSTDAYTYWIEFSEWSHQHRTPCVERLMFGDRMLFYKRDQKWISQPQVVPQVPLEGITLGNLNGVPEAALAFQLLTRGLGCYDFPGNVLQSITNSSQVFGPGGGFGRSIGTGGFVRSNGGVGGYSDRGENYLATSEAILDDFTKVKDWNALTRTLSTLNSAIQTVGITQPTRDGLIIGYKTGDKTIVMDCGNESEGFRRYLATLLALNQAPSKATILFEHPEHAIHPGALETLANEFKRHVNRGRGQIILTTHSPQFLDNFEPEQIRVVEIENQETKIGPLASEQAEGLKRKLLFPGELLTVDPARLEGELVGAP